MFGDLLHAQQSTTVGQGHWVQGLGSQGQGLGQGQRLVEVAYWQGRKRGGLGLRAWAGTNQGRVGQG